MKSIVRTYRGLLVCVLLNFKNLEDRPDLGW
jgi:hypothetical protein